MRGHTPTRSVPAILVMIVAIAAVIGLAACAPPAAEPDNQSPPASTAIPFSPPANTPQPAQDGQPSRTTTDIRASTPPAEEESQTVTNKTYQWAAAPDMQIDPSKQYTATLETEVGAIVIALTADKTPVTVNNFVFLAREGYYDGTTFHRVIPEFMVQGGDRTGTGSGGPGYTIVDEFDPTLRHDSAGVLSMANIGRPSTGGGQFFITLAPTPWLDDAHTVFGKVTDDLDVVQKIRIRDPGTDPNPGTRLISVTITES